MLIIRPRSLGRMGRQLLQDRRSCVWKPWVEGTWREHLALQAQERLEPPDQDLRCRTPQVHATNSLPGTVTSICSTTDHTGGKILLERRLVQVLQCQCSPSIGTPNAIRRIGLQGALLPQNQTTSREMIQRSWRVELCNV
ncbi:unnamed protein product [Lepidochelys kempii]